MTYQTTTYAKRVMNEKGFNVVTIGSGDSILKQSPSAGTTQAEQKRVFLLTNKGWKMPRIIGWSKADVEKFCSLTGLKLESTGSGYADSQSINFEKSIDTGDVLKVNFE